MPFDGATGKSDDDLTQEYINSQISSEDIAGLQALLEAAKATGDEMTPVCITQAGAAKLLRILKTSNDCMDMMVELLDEKLEDTICRLEESVGLGLLTQADLAAMVGKIVQFKPEIINWDMYAAPRMKARVVKFAMEPRLEPHDEPEDVVHKLYVDFTEFEVENHKLQEANYYDTDGVACLTAVEAGWYEPQDWLYVGARKADLPFKVVGD